MVKKKILQIFVYVTGPAKIGHVGSQNLTSFQNIDFTPTY